MAQVFHSTSNGNEDDPTYRVDGLSVITSDGQQQENSHERSGIVLNYDYNTDGQEPIDHSRIKVSNDQNRPKRPKHFCFLCRDENVEKRTTRVAEERMYFNLQRHWESFHPEHRRVLEIKAAVTSQERRKLVDKLKNEGNQYYNNTFAEKTGKIKSILLILIFHQIYL